MQGSGLVAVTFGWGSMIGLSHSSDTSCDGRFLVCQLNFRAGVRDVAFRPHDWLLRSDLAYETRTKRGLVPPHFCSARQIYIAPASRSCAVEKLQNVFESPRVFPACGRKGESPGLAVCIAHRGSLPRRKLPFDQRGAS